jgi:FkbM family methyltransferase
MVDGVRVVVPDSLEIITSYVLREQEDWFEDEIKVLRRLLQPGQKVIDIGANYGVYALSMARTVGPTGSVAAFEPASGTARMLAAGIAANGFANVSLHQCAVSDIGGAGRLSLAQSPELNALTQAEAPPGATEAVSLATLDDCLQKYGWRDIDFVKIDAEGAEDAILRGGKRFFAELSPLVQYEVKAAHDLHLELVRSFDELGYRSYRLVPGLDLLVPFDATAKADEYLLNLFCCKPDRAAALASRGLLLDSVADDTGTRHRGDTRDAGARSVGDWSRPLVSLPYGSRLANEWGRTMAEGNSTEVAQALALYAYSRDASLPIAERFRGLDSSLALLKSLCERQPSRLRLASLARVARDHGTRSLAVRALAYLADMIDRTKKIDVGEPFLAPCERFDTVAPGRELARWVLSAVLEAYERLHAFSSFFAGPTARRRLETIRDLGLGSPEMQRRLSLLQQRFGPPAATAGDARGRARDSR